MSLPSIPPLRRSPLTDELEAMAVVGHALDSLPDRAAQQRVLRWAADRLKGEESHAAADIVHRDSTLDVENLHDLFDDDREREGLKLVSNRD